MTDSKLNCAICPDRHKCEKTGILCEEASRYVNQDNHRPRIRTKRVHNIDDLPDMQEGRSLLSMLKEKLSPREDDVARLLMEGHSARRTAQILGISRLRVRRCIERIKVKMGHGPRAGHQEKNITDL